MNSSLEDRGRPTQAFLFQEMAQVILSSKFTSLKSFLRPGNPHTSRVLAPWELGLVFGKTISEENFACISYYNSLESEVDLEKGHISYMYLNRQLSKYNKTLIEDHDIATTSTYEINPPTADGTKLLQKLCQNITDSRAFWL